MHPSIEVEVDESALARAAEMLRNAAHVTVLTGAGVSAESGVPTFRGAGGLWEGHHVEEVATPEAFAADPALVWRFYNMRRTRLWSVRPNPGHFALAELERRWQTNAFAVCTQNIDGLHRAAGSRNVLELHGNLTRVRCTRCSFHEEKSGEDLPELPHCLRCQALLRPDIVWFHEMLPQDVWQEANRWAAKSECFLVVGTSAVVYPAAGLVDVAQAAGAALVEINVEESAVSQRADVALRGKSGAILPRLVEMLGSEGCGPQGSAT